MCHELTPEERKQWDVDPDLWPHTPPFHVFAALMDEDDNTWWRAGSGHGLNAYEAARERIEELEAAPDYQLLYEATVRNIERMARKPARVRLPSEIRRLDAARVMPGSRDTDD